MLCRYGSRLVFAYIAGDDRVRLMRGTEVVRELVLDEAARLVVAIAPTLADRTAMLDAGLRVEAGGALVRVHRGATSAAAWTPFPALRAA
jgi:hypothetical protein